MEAARGAVTGYLAAKTAAEKHEFVLPGVSEEDIARYLKAGGEDPGLAREDIVFSARHSDLARHWYSFTLTPPGTLKEIRTFVSMAGGVPALHWPAYVQEKDGTAVAPKYALGGIITQIKTKSGRDKESYFNFKLTLTDLKTGLAVWEDEKEVVKQETRPLIGG